MRVAVLDDYQGVALEMADWSPVTSLADVSVFRSPLVGADAIVSALANFEIISVMRERTHLTRNILERLPKLRLIASTGVRNASIDMTAAVERGIAVRFTGYLAWPTIELTWAPLLMSARSIVDEVASVRAGSWQHTVGTQLHGKTLGVLGLGTVGREVARIGSAFGMDVITWSQNLDAERAAAAGASLVPKDELFARSDFLTIHLVLSERTRGLVNAEMLQLMKPTAHLINTSRGAIIEDSALMAALDGNRLRSAALDVFDIEPLPPTHPWRSHKRVITTPHIGYVSDDLYRRFYKDTVANIASWLATATSPDTQAPNPPLQAD